MIAAIYILLILGLAAWLIVGMIGIVRMKSNHPIHKILIDKAILEDLKRNAVARHDFTIVDPQEPESSWQRYVRTTPDLPPVYRNTKNIAEAQRIHDDMMADARATARKERAAYDTPLLKGRDEQRGRGGRS